LIGIEECLRDLRMCWPRDRFRFPMKTCVNIWVYFDAASMKRVSSSLGSSKLLLTKMRLIDTHCHIDLYPDYNKLIEEIERARIYTIAVTNTPSVFRHCLSLTEGKKFIRTALGLHPQLVVQRHRELGLMLEMLPETKYVGEIGLDFVSQDKQERTLQQKVFMTILERCATFPDKVLTIHSRRAAAEVVNLIGDSYPCKVILHWFSGSHQILDKAIDYGFYFSLPGMRWEPAIRRAIRESEFFLALLSEKSVTKRGYVQKERKDALDILDEFPEDQVFFIPIRLENCQLPSERLRGIQYVDFFPGWKQGLEKVLKSINIASPSVAQKENVPIGYEYRCGIVDFDNGLTNLPQLCHRLNLIQSFFHFNHPNITLRKKKPRRFEGEPNLYISSFPRGFYEQKCDYLNVDLVACLTQYLLAFEDEDGLFWNYLSAPSMVDDTFLFISTNELYEASKQAGCTFEKGIVYNILSQLIVYFAANLGFHKEVRGSILDLCVNRSTMVKGLKAMRLCTKCSSKMKNLELKAAVEAILADAIRV